MTLEAGYLLLILVAAMVFFYTGWLRTDVTALGVLTALILPWRPVPGSGLAAVLGTERAFAGFGSPALIMVASMFVLSSALVQTGGAEIFTRKLLQAGARSERLLQFTILGVITAFSAFINDTTTVLIWMPMVLTLCREKGHAPSRVLLLLAYASLLGGQWTLIGTRSNILISDYLRTRSGEGLSFFSFTPIAAAVWGTVMVFIFLLGGRRLLPAGGVVPSTAERYEVTEYLTEVLVAPDTGAAGRTLEEMDLAARHGVTVLQVIRGDQYLQPASWLRISPGDVLVVQGRISRITQLLGRPGLQLRQELQIGESTLRSVDLRMVEALIAPGSELAGRTLEEMNLLDEYGISVLGLARHGQTLSGRPANHRLQFGDSLLLVGHDAEIDRLRRIPNFFLLESRALPAVGRFRAYLSLSLLAAVAVFSASRLLEPAVAIPLAAFLAVITRCVGIRQAYRSLDVQALVVVGAMIPYGLALEDSGTAAALAHAVAGLLMPHGPFVVLAALTLFAILLTQLIENAAVAIILAPIAYELAQASGADPTAFLLGIAICVSTAFMSPVAHESTILVMSPGRYRFADYLRLGTPLALITWIVTLLVLPLFYPLTVNP